MGQSRLSADQLVAWYRANAPASLPYRASSIGARPARADVRERGQPLQRARRHRVRAVDRRDGVVQLPGLRAGAAVEQQLLGHRRVRLVRQRLPVQLARSTACARRSSCCATTPTAARASTTIPDPPVPELWGSNPATAAYNFDHYFHKGRRAALEHMGNGNWATAPNYATDHPERLQPDAHLQRPARAVPARRPALRPAHRGRPVPGRACASRAAPSRRPVSGGLYVLNGNGAVTAFNGAPVLGRRRRSTPTSRRDIAVMPDGGGLRGADRHRPGAQVRLRRPIADTVGPLGMALLPGGRPGAVDRDHARRQGLRRSCSPTARISQVRQRGDRPDRRRSADPLFRRRRRPVDRGHARRRRVRGARPPRWRATSTAARRRVRSVPASTPYWGIDLGRDIVLVHAFGQAFGYYVLDALGRCSGTSGAPGAPQPARPRCSPTAGAASRSTAASPSLLRNDGTTVAHDPPTLVTRSWSEDDDGAQHLAALHLVERLLDVVERDGLAHEAVEVEAARRGTGR